MIAYNRTYLANIGLIKKANYWFGKKLLSREQLTAITNRYTLGFYTPALFIKIGLFIFACILISAAVSLYSLFFVLIGNSNFDNNFFPASIGLIFSAACFAALEFLIKRKNIYRSGIDEALLYSGIGFLYTLVWCIFDDVIYYEHISLFYSLLSIPILGVTVFRYADRFVALLFIISLYSAFFFLILKLGEVAKMIMPFAFMILSAVIYTLAKQNKQKENLWPWKPCLVVFECIALLVFYGACNYFVIRESSLEFFGLSLLPGEDIPLAFVFYILTALVPVAYIFYGLKRKDKILLGIGLALIAASVLTFKYYFSLGHPEITLTATGIIMIVIAYTSIKFLKIPKYGIAFTEDEGEDNFLKTNAEALIIAETFTPEVQEIKTTELGGGDFGGAGAGSKF